MWYEQKPHSSLVVLFQDHSFTFFFTCLTVFHLLRMGTWAGFWSLRSAAPHILLLLHFCSRCSLGLDVVCASFVALFSKLLCLLLTFWFYKYKMILFFIHHFSTHIQKIHGILWLVKNQIYLSAWEEYITLKTLSH